MASRKLAIFLLVSALILAVVTPVLASDSNGNSSLPTTVDGYPIPKEIGGMPVIFVHTPENTSWLQPGEVCIALLDTAVDPNESPANVSVLEFMRDLPEGWTITVVGGPNTSKAEYERLTKEANEFYDRNGPGPKSCAAVITSVAPDVKIDALVSESLLPSH